jgi:hypothetical protein
MVMKLIVTIQGQMDNCGGTSVVKATADFESLPAWRYHVIVHCILTC